MRRVFSSRSTSSTAALVLIVAALAMQSSMVSSSFDVYVFNDLGDVEKRLNVQCRLYDSDFDTGVHDLGYIEYLNWTINDYSPLGDTLYYCDFTFSNGHKAQYPVFNAGRDSKRCLRDQNKTGPDYKCFWAARQDGLYFWGSDNYEAYFVLQYTWPWLN
ncbi:S-protein homolog 6-like [Malania oleifera]|uniref:S-protein homolog 6-like n=1 Tax=Malania oleifera TaxID=397392 RepID=UPI0025AEB941|nr:S-protein homolog 6-like [Malania oleifera]